MDRLVSLHKLSQTEQMDMFAMAGHGNGNQPQHPSQAPAMKLYTVADALVRQAACG